jgi:hypothetical protein
MSAPICSTGVSAIAAGHRHQIRPGMIREM